MNANDYFRSYVKYFWLWEDETEVLAINGGSTIAYTEELIPIMDTIAERGLPSFGAILCALIAINKTEENSLDFVYKILSALEFNEHFKNSDLEESFNFLAILQSLPDEYKIGKRKQILLTTIFENAHNRIKSSTSKGIVNVLKEKKRRTSFQKLSVLTKSVLAKDIKVFQILSRKFTNIQSIIDEMGNLPEIEEELLPQLDTRSTTEKNYKDFVEELMDNSQTFQIGALIKPIWAGFSVPIFNAHPSEQPLGGVSDLSNKGDFDKLLISEFANDDLLFMSRLANNEALYLHREMPPITDKLQRIMLIDISLKTWGIPKILGYASSLAISKHPKSKSESKLFLVGDTFLQMEYEKASSIIDGLQQVALSLNAQKGIAAFLESNKQNKQLEIFYITTPEGLKYPEIARILADNHTLFRYIITTNMDGNIHFYKNKNNAFKHLQTIKLPLEKLWEKPLKPFEQKIIPYVPASKEVYPLLLPLPKKRSRLIPIGNEVYFVSNRCLFRIVNFGNQTNKKGCELILTNVPTNSNYELGKTDKGIILFLSFNPQNREVIITDLETLQYAKVFFHDWKYTRTNEFIFLREQFTFLIRNPEAYTFNTNFDTKIIEIEKKKFDSSAFNNDYTARQKQCIDLNTAFKGLAFNVLKNLKEVYINEENRLVFNSHQLQFQYGMQDLQFYHYNKMNKDPKVKAHYDSSKKVYIFSEGSEISVNGNGFFTLKSSKKDIPVIYISSAIDKVLGVATEIYFAGYDYFYSIPYFTFRLQSSGLEKLTATKILKTYSGIGLKDAKDIIDNAPIQFALYMKNDDAEKMTEELQGIGFDVAFYGNKKEQTIISTQEFYNTYIQKFITQIVKYESKN
ncbi:MAG TPA: ribosomal protein L7/L12 [Saprospiraceae bacterium]|nr:ribosomal protein L7/L12 [Saprospiraceae bacterium]